jgi:hypothetical protein
MTTLLQQPIHHGVVMLLLTEALHRKNTSEEAVTFVVLFLSS